jgi:outer membrane translocation and assembly module TamA
MEAEAASFDAIDQINARLAQRPEFAEVRVSDAKASAKENRVKFRVSATLSEGI